MSRLHLLQAALVSVIVAPLGRAAAEPLLSFDVPSAPLSQALIDTAARAGVSLGLVAECHGHAPRMNGRSTVHAAIERLLAGSDCRAVWVGPRTVRIDRRPSAPPPLRPTVAASAASVDEVVVTAPKRGVSVFDLPGSATIVNAKQLAAVHAVDTRDLALLTPGMTVTDLGPGRDKVLLRGLSDGAFTGHTQTTVGIYWDGAPVTYNAPDPDLRLVDVQSVEVLRGPQGTLYGAGAIGGVLNIVPNKPDFDHLSGLVDVGGAATAHGAPDAETDGVLNLPLLGGRAAVRLVGYGEEDGGYTAEPLQHRQDANGVQRTGLRAALAVQAAPQWIVTLGNTYQDLYSNDTQYTTPGSASLVRDTRVSEPHDNDFEQVYLDVAGAGAWGNLRAVSSYVNHGFDSRYDASSALPEFGDSSGAAGAYDDDTLVRLASQEIDFRPATMGKLTLLVGAYGAYGLVSETARLAPIQGRSLYSEQRTDEMTDLALFGEATYAITDRLDATLGLRAFLASRRTLSRVDQGASEGDFAGSTTMRDVAPKMALHYRPVRHATLYVLASEGYRPGGFNTSGTADQTFSSEGGPQPNRRYQPDQLWNIEFGGRIDAFQGRLNLQTALYYDVWSQLQADQFASSGLPYVANVGDARVYGWEQEASVALTPRATLQLGALFTAPDLHNVDPSFAAGQSDFTLPGVARRSVNGQLTYQLPLSSGRRLQLSAAARYVGRSYLFFGPQGSASMGDYIEARAQALLTTRFADLSLYVENPADSRGNAFAFGNPFTLRAGAQTTPLTPRRLGFRISRSF